MSGSPKHCNARLQQAREEELRRERARRAEEERQRQRQAEERRRRERVAQAKSSSTQQSARVEQRASQLAAAPHGKFVSGETAALRQQLAALAPALAVATTEEEVAEHQARIATLESELRQVAARGEAAKLASELAREEAELARTSSETGALDLHASLKHDRAGLQQVKAKLEQAKQALAGKKPDQCAAETASARTLLAAHRQTVSAKSQAERSRREASRARLDRAGDRVASLGQDELTRRWAAPEAAELAAQWQRAAGLVESEQFASAEAEAARLMTVADELAARVQEQQLAEERRQYIVAGMEKVLGQMGFFLSPAGRETAAGGALRLRAVRASDRQSIAITVPHDGSIAYEMEGFPKRSEPRAGGKTVATCDEAETQLETFHRELDKQFGVQMSELSWQGRDPQHALKQAELLPEHAAAQQAQQRSAGQD